MTASLPNPFESPADDAGDQSVDGTDARPVAAPKPRAPRTNPRRPGTASKAGAKPRAPRKPSAPRPSVAPVADVPGPTTEAPARGIPADTSIDPGPPPPLPTDLSALVIPPKPPLPPVPSLPADLTEGEPVGELETEPDLEAEPEVEAEAVVEPEGEAEAVVEPETEAEAVVEPEVEAEAVVEPETDPEVDTRALIEPDAELEPDDEPEAELVESEPVVEQPEADAPEGESITDAELERDSFVETELEPEIAEPGDASDSVLVESEPVDDVADDEAVVVPSAIVGEPLERVDAAADAAAPALTLRGVTKVFGDTRAVDGIDLTVPAGSFYGLVGPNGAGKTTTLSMIAGLLRPDAGTISIGGIDASRKGAATKRLMGVLPDRLRTFDRLTGRQLLYYYGVLRGLPSAVVESRTTDLARAFDLTGALGRSVSDYSAGMTKKVMLAGAMIHSPRLLVLDEPFEAVDPVSSAVILDILSTYVAHGGTVILSSHGMELVERVCSGVAVIVAGQVLAEGTVDEVRGESTLEQRFLELAGGLGDTEGLEWLHTFSD